MEGVGRDLTPAAIAAGASPLPTVTRTSRRRAIPFEEWSRGDHGYILFCVQHFRLAGWRARAGKAASCVVYKTEGWADFHATRFGHDMLAVQDAPALALRFDQRRLV